MVASRASTASEHSGRPWASVAGDGAALDVRGLPATVVAAVFEAAVLRGGVAGVFVDGLLGGVALFCVVLGGVALVGVALVGRCVAVVAVGWTAAGSVVAQVRPGAASMTGDAEVPVVGGAFCTDPATADGIPPAWVVAGAGVWAAAVDGETPGTPAGADAGADAPDATPVTAPETGTPAVNPAGPGAGAALEEARTPVRVGAAEPLIAAEPLAPGDP